MSYHFHHALVGGTFDRFHLGHEKLLTAAFEQSAKVTIGIATADLFRDKQFIHLIEDFQIREQTVSEFLSDKGFNDRAEMIPISDIYGTSLDDTTVDAIFVTESTRANAIRINEEREKRSLQPLEIVLVPFVFGNDGEIISSERIRKGLIDRGGNSYEKLFEKQSSFVLPEKEREAIRLPIGPIYTDMKEVLSLMDKDALVVAVGDIVAASLMQAGRQADVSVIDGKTRRELVNPTQTVDFAKTEKTETQNPAGTITQEAVKALQSVIGEFTKTQKPQLLIVSGEEDLLAIPAVLLTPLSSIVVYGQFDQGIVVVEVTEQNKKRVKDLFGKFQ